MKKILLITNYVFHYRIAIYDYFYSEFLKIGCEFHVLSNQFQDVQYDPKFIKHVVPFSISKCIKKIQAINPDVVINFLHLKDWLIFPLTIYCRFNEVPIIYWNHGINLEKANNYALNSVYKTIHRLSNAVILYTPNELKYLSTKARNKVFIAYNTLCFEQVDKKRVADKRTVMKKYGINEDRIVLFISRIMPYKRLDILLEVFLDENDMALVIVGQGINEQQLKLVNEVQHYYYLGEKYGNEVDEIYNMGDVFSTPGHIGLALIQAFFWGKPVVVLNVRHAPEIYYLKNGKNGYIANNENELKENILSLLRNKNKYNDFSRTALKTVEKEARIERMFKGFHAAVTYCMNEKY